MSGTRSANRPAARGDGGRPHAGGIASGATLHRSPTVAISRAMPGAGGVPESESITERANDRASRVNRTVARRAGPRGAARDSGDRSRLAAHRRPRRADGRPETWVACAWHPGGNANGTSRTPDAGAAIPGARDHLPDADTDLSTQRMTP